jgi:hypothetical protein
MTTDADAYASCNVKSSPVTFVGSGKSPTLRETGSSETSPCVRARRLVAFVAENTPGGEDGRDAQPQYQCRADDCLYRLTGDELVASVLECPACKGRIFKKLRKQRTLVYSPD